MPNIKGWQRHIRGKKFIASFSGGKDSSLGLYKAMEEGETMALIVMLEEDGNRSRAHGMSTELIRAQAQSIGLPVKTASAGWNDYEAAFVQLLSDAQSRGAEVLVTGDLDVPGHGSWHEKVTKKAGLKLAMPLKDMEPREVVDAFIKLGFQAIVIKVNLSLGMKKEDLGRRFTSEFVKEMESRGIDPCGEGGEFHTAVVDGPIFSQAVPVRQGDMFQDGDNAFLPLEPDYNYP